MAVLGKGGRHWCNSDWYCNDRKGCIEMMESPYKSFSHYETPNNDFERARQQISTPFDYWDLDLSVARTNEIIPIAGDFLYIDLVSNGNAILELNNQQDAKKAPFYVQKGFALAATFKQLKITNQAQAGGLLRIMYSTGERVIPATGQMQVTGNVTTLEDGFVYGASYKSNTPVAANTPEVIFSPGSNLNGALIHDLRYWDFANSVTLGAFIVKSSSPANNLDGDVILIGDNANTSGLSSGKITKPISVPAGKGLYFICSLNETSCQRMALYSFK